MSKGRGLKHQFPRTSQGSPIHRAQRTSWSHNQLPYADHPTSLGTISSGVLRVNFGFVVFFIFLSLGITASLMKTVLGKILVLIRGTWRRIKPKVFWKTFHIFSIKPFPDSARWKQSSFSHFPLDVHLQLTPWLLCEACLFMCLFSLWAWLWARYGQDPQWIQHFIPPPHYTQHKTDLHAKLLHFCSTLCKPVDCSPPGSSVHGVFQARIPEWVAMPHSRGSSWPRDLTCIFWGSCIAGRFFPAGDLNQWSFHLLESNFLQNCY